MAQPLTDPEIIAWKPGDSRFEYEHQMQAMQYRWFWNIVGEPYRRMLYCINNNSAGAVRGATNKTLGVTPGASDMAFISFGETIYIENKLPGKTQSDEQIDFMLKCLDRGVRYVICYSFEGLQRFLLNEINKHEQ